MRSYLVFIVAAVLSSLVSPQQRGPSTPEERARVVKTAKALQSAYDETRYLRTLVTRGSHLTSAFAAAAASM